MRHVALVVVTCAVAVFAGCAHPDGAASSMAEHDAAIQVPGVGPGASAEYAGPEGVALKLTLLDPWDVLDTSGAQVTLLPLRIEGERDFGSGPTSTEIVQLLDAEGRRAMVASRCPTLGLGYHPPAHPCTASTRAVASYLEHGLPGALGAAPFWGAEIKEGPHDITHSFMGRSFTMRYIAEVSEEEECVELRSEEPAPLLLSGQRFSTMGEIPSQLVLCADSPFPREVAFGEETYQRTSHSGLPDAPAGPLSTAADPWRRPASADAKPLVRGIPAGSEYDAQGFPVSEAVDHLRRSMSSLESSFLRYTTVHEAFRGELKGVGTTDLQVDRLVVMENEDELVSSVVRKTCDLTGCRITTERSQSMRDEPSLIARTALASIDLRSLEQKANHSIGHPAFQTSFGSVLTDVGLPDYGPGDAFLYRFFALEPGGAGLPFFAFYHGTSGALLRLDAPDGRIAEQFGLPWEYLQGE